MSVEIQGVEGRCSHAASSCSAPASSIRRHRRPSTHRPYHWDWALLLRSGKEGIILRAYEETEGGQIDRKKVRESLLRFGTILAAWALRALLRWFSESVRERPEGIILSNKIFDSAGSMQPSGALQLSNLEELGLFKNSERCPIQISNQRRSKETYHEFDR